MAEFHYRRNTTATPAEITVLGNGVSIADGDTTPSTGDGTDFGSAAQGAAAVVRTFTVRNDGGSTLTLGTPTLPTGFSLVAGDPLVSSLAPGASDTFQVQMSTASAGTKSGQISFTNNDSNESPFNFSITGTVNATATPAEITVLGNGVSIADGDTTPSTGDGTDFGSAAQGAAAVVQTFTVRNDGGSILTLGTPTLPTGFSLVASDPLVSSLAPGASDTFQVQMSTASAGTKSGQISFTNNDSNESPFNFSITGTVNSGGGVTPMTSLFTASDTPAQLNNNDGTPIEVGVKFESSIAGQITALKFYRSPNDTGSDLLDLWTATGSKLASVTFTNTAASGWQTVALSTPVAIAANTNYIVSYHTTGTYVETDDFFTTDFASGVLTATTTAGGNGLYAYGGNSTTGLFPTNTYSAANYWADVVFAGNIAPAEITVLGNGVSIADGDTTPSTGDGTDFGSAAQGAAAVVRTFTVRNDGGSILTLGTPTLPTGFSLVASDPLVSSLAPGASDTFQVQMSTASAGTESGQISFTNNDSNESPFNFSITGTVNATATPAEITVLGNGVSIADGDTTPSTGDGTDFGSAAQGAAAVVQTFTVRNDGGSILTLGTPTLPTGFSLVASDPLVSSLAPGASDTFQVQMSTASAGTKSGQISFTNNDSNESPFNFSITGTVSATATPAEITVLGNGVSIADGDTTPSTGDGTDFGSAAQGAAAVVRTFTVRNDGGSTLTLGTPTLPTGFSLVAGDPLVSSLAPGASDTFQVQMSTASAGTESGQISFTNNDSNESPFNFSITGTVNATATPAEITVLGNGVSIADGDTTPSTGDGTDFGSAAQGAAAVVRTFTVRNDGGSTLTLGTPTLPTGFSLVASDPLVSSLAPGASDTFQVQMSTASAGTESGQISFTNNDSNESPFNFSITGTVNSVSSGGGQSTILYATPANFASQVSAATAGQTIVLASGNYGTWTGTNKAITITAASGASPQMNFNFGSGDANFTLDSMTGMGGYIGSGASNITIKNSTFTSQLDIEGAVTNVVIDHNSFTWVNDPSSKGLPAKIFLNTSGSSPGAAVTIKNNDIENGDLDGIQIGAGSGDLILNNTFKNLIDVGYNHTDNIQFVGSSSQIDIKGNYIYAAGPTQGITSYDGGTNGIIVENNVVDIPRDWGIELYDDHNSIVRHNTVVYHPKSYSEFGTGTGYIDINTKGPPGSGTLVYDNITSGVSFSNGSTGTAYNNVSGAAALYVGGASPTTHDGFLLASNSPVGIGAASDGSNIGVWANSLAPAGVAGEAINLGLTNPTNHVGPITVNISAVPSGWTISSGSDNGDGTWTVQSNDIPSLSVTSPESFTGALVLNVAESWINVDGSSGNAIFADNVEVYARGAPIFALSSDDNLTGSIGDDLFVFAGPIGNDVVYNFNVASDKVDLIGFDNVASFSDIQANLTEDTNGNAVIAIGAGETITLHGVDASSLNANDFAFDQQPVTNNTGNMVVSDGAMLPLGGIVNNSGTIVLNSTSNETDLEVIQHGITLQDGGALMLSDSGGNAIFGTDPGVTLTNVDNTIFGAGQLGEGRLTLHNGGTIIASGGNALTIDTGENAVVNSGILEATGSGGLAIHSDVANSGLLWANGGSVRIDGNVSGTGSALIDGVATFEMGGAFAEKIRLDAGANATLKIDHTADFSGTVAGFDSNDVLDLADLVFGSNTALGYTANANNTGGILTVSDGMHTANIALLGQYTAASFVMSADGFGGTLIDDLPSATPTQTLTSELCGSGSDRR